MATYMSIHKYMYCMYTAAEAGVSVSGRYCACSFYMARDDTRTHTHKQRVYMNTLAPPGVLLRGVINMKQTPED